MANFSGCAISSGIALDCRSAIGGLEKVYITNLANAEVTYDLTSGTTCEIATIYKDGVAIPTNQWFVFEVPKQSSNFTENAIVNQANNTLYFEQVVALVFSKLQCDIRNQMLLLAQNTKLLVVVKDNNGLYWSVGLIRGAELTAGVSQTGTAYSDLSGYNVTLTGYETEPTFLIDATTVLGL